jgi:hypothetical protein
VKVPRIASARALPGFVLRVEFEGGETRDYEAGPLLSRDPFRLLREPALFRAFAVEPSGHALVWNDDIDLAAYELFRGGQPVKPDPRATLVQTGEKPAGVLGTHRPEDPVDGFDSFHSPRSG